MISRETALERLHAQHPDAGLSTHALATEAVMHALATHFSENTELWSRTGLLHDIDFPLTKQMPERHGLIALELLPDLPEEGRNAIAAHNGEHTGRIPQTRFDFALRCGETVTGLVVAAALVRPEGMQGMQAKSLKKKMKDKAFAASVCRETIRECEKLPLSLDDFLSLAITALQGCEESLGLKRRES